MNISAPLIAHLQPSKLVQPSQRPFDHPSMPAQPRAAVNATTGDTWDNPTLAQVVPILARSVRLVGMQVRRSATWATTRAADGGDGIHHLRQQRRFVRVRCGMADREWRATPIHDQMPFRATLAAIRRVASRFLAPLGAGTLAASSEARSQAIWFAIPNWSSNTRCNRSQMPACCQSRKRRQQVMPLPQPISWGSSSHWMPVLSTNKIPVSAARFATRGRPPFGFGGSGGKSGSITVHNSSGTSGFAMLPWYQLYRFC